MVLSLCEALWTADDHERDRGDSPARRVVGGATRLSADQTPGRIQDGSQLLAQPSSGGRRAGLRRADSAWRLCSTPRAPL